MIDRVTGINPAGGRPPLRYVQMGPISFRLNMRVLLMSLLAVTILVMLGAWAMTLGSFRLSISDVVQSVLGSGSEEAGFIVRDLRMPRVLSAMLIGPMLAMSGAIFQGVVRNPLVSPDIIGINAGAALAAVFWIVTNRPLEFLPVVAFVGAVAAAAAIYLLSWQGHISASRLVLVGIGINALLGALTTLFLLRSDINEASRAVLWMTGSIYSSTWYDVRVLLIGLAILLPLGTGLMWALRVVQVGDLTARSVGLPLERTRLTLILVACGMSAIAVSIAGPIGFVALMVPHLARMLAGPMSGSVFVFSGVLGALLLLGADMVGQHALPVALPVGVVTAVVGAPYFLFLLYRTNTNV